jgi:chromosomal replication initiator protein
MTKQESIYNIYNEVCNYFDATPTDNKNRKREFVEVRQVAHYLCREINETNSIGNSNPFGISLKDIGRIIGGKHHASVLYSCKVVKDRLSYDKTFIKNIDELKDKCIKYKYEYKGLKEALNIFVFVVSEFINGIWYIKYKKDPRSCIK